MSFFQRWRRTASTSAGSDPLAGYAPTCDDPLSGYAPSPRPVAAPKRHEPPPDSELADLIRLYQRRRDEIAQDQSLAYDASLQALSIVVHAYRARYRCSTAEAAAVLRPLTIGAMG
jgi:hypothetical protein